MKKPSLKMPGFKKPAFMKSPDEHDGSLNLSASSASDQSSTPVGAQPRPPAVKLLALPIVTILSALSTLAFGTVFSSWNFLIPAVVGAVLGTVITLLAQRFKLLFGEVLALSIVLPLIAGPLVSGGMGFFSGAVFGWVELLSSTPPVDVTSELRALPLLTAFFASVVGGEFLRPRRQSSLAVIGPILGLITTALFTSGDDTIHLAVGLSMVAGLLMLAWVQRVEDHAAVAHEGDTFAEGGLDVDDDGAGASRRGRSTSGHGRALLLALAALLPVIALSPFLGPRLPFAAATQDRLDLRELQTPPWNPLELPSPLVETKAALLSAERAGQDVPLFRATLSPGSEDGPVTRFRSATLIGYDGVFWGIAEPDREADFIPVDTELPVALGDEATAGRVDSLTITPLTGLGHWVPVPGVPTRIDFAADVDVRMSASTSTLGSPNALQAGQHYEVSYRDWPTQRDGDLAGFVFAADGRPTEPELLPPTIRTTAADFTTGFGQLSGQRVISIRDQLRQGSYDLGVAPGHSYGQLAELLIAIETDGSDPSSPVYEMRGVRGYEEQYAAVAALLVRLSDIPVRVATGWIIPEDRWADGSATVLRSDASAWIEVLIDGTGWMPIDVTPERTQEPIDVESGTEEVGVPIAQPPKEPPPPDDVERPEISEAEPTPTPEATPEPEEELVSARRLPVATVVGVSLLVPVALFGIFAAAVILWKGMRRKRRRAAHTPDAQIAGAWAELMDRLSESGVELPQRSSPRQVANVLGGLPTFSDHEARGRIRRLADGVSASAFHPSEPDDRLADAAWEDYDGLAADIRAQAKTAERLRMSVDPRPLLGEDSRVGSRS